MPLFLKAHETAVLPLPFSFVFYSYSWIHIIFPSAYSMFLNIFIPDFCIWPKI